MKTLRYYLVPLFIFAAVLLADHCSAATCGNAPGMRECTDADFNPQAKLMRKAPLLAAYVRSVGHVCERVIVASLDNAPGIDYYHVTCSGQLQYTIGVSAKGVVVWPGYFTN